MALELTSSEVSAIDALWKTWVTAPDCELEATFQALDYSAFLSIIKTLRTLGLREEPQPPKLNIMVEGGLRFTLVGEAVIESFCKDNTLKGKPFHVVLKERKAGAANSPSEVDLREYNVRIKVRREHDLAVDNERVMRALASWATLPKSFRYIRRYSFTSTQHKHIVFDASFVRESKRMPNGSYVQAKTFLDANLSKQPVRYEMEVEAKSGATKGALLTGVAYVLRGIQRSHVILRNITKQNAVALMAAQSRAAAGTFPGPQPKTLTKANMSPDDASIPNIRLGDYNVTDKADGLRCLLLVGRDGRMYMIDRNLNVYGTDRRMDDVGAAEWGGALLDGEWVTQDAQNNPVSRYYAFDIYNGRGGADVSQRPFLVRGADMAVSRLAEMTEAVSALNAAAYTVAGIPKQHSLSIQMKTFYTAENPADPHGIFKKSADVLDRLSVNPPYHTDGLIFTPNAAPLPKNRRTFEGQLKWKPAHMNSVDFLVEIEHERDIHGKPTKTDLISFKTQEDTQSIVRYKTLRLFVGSSTHPAFINPRETVLHKKPYPAELDFEHGGTARGEYKPVEFAPGIPPDPMASVCYVAIDAGITDAAGAAPAARYESTDDIYCTDLPDPIYNRTIVEMRYDPARPAGWRWIPMRVRWDKTEKINRGIITDTLNAEGTANNVWTSIHDPITERMIRTGALTEEEGSGADGQAASSVAYYQRKSSQRDMYKIRNMTAFHNGYVKDNLLLGRVLKQGDALLDMSMGQAGDLHIWIRRRAGLVVGCDLALSGLVENKNGAYSRYLKEIVKSRGAVAPMLFIQADSSKRYSDGSAGQTQLDRTLLRALWGEHDPSAPVLAQDLRGAASAGFDVASMMFALHYFFKDRSSLDGLLLNISETVRVNGYFVGCCFDGDTVASFLSDLPLGGTKRGTEDMRDIWTITKKYEGASLPASDEGLGRAIDFSFISIGETFTEYLVSWSYFVQRMSEIGMELLNPEELDGLGLKHSTAMFRDSHKMAHETGRSFPMSPVVSALSFLNRWFIFKRRSTGMFVAPVSAALAPAVLAPMPAAPAPEIPVEAAPVPVAAPVPAAPEVPVVEVPVPVEEVPAPVEEEPAPAAPVLKVATGPAHQFYNKSAAKDDLKIGQKYWKRLLSTYAPFEFTDPSNPTITYNSLEAAIGAAKFQIATNRPELGAQLFSVNGKIYQDSQQQRAGKKLDFDDEWALVEAEGAAYRDAAKPTAMRKVGAIWNQTAWDNAVERVLTGYVRQRYEKDATFRAILEAVAKHDVRLVFYIPGAGNELSGNIRADGSIEGANLYGRALMRLVGLTL